MKKTFDSNVVIETYTGTVEDAERMKLLLSANKRVESVMISPLQDNMVKISVTSKPRNVKRVVALVDQYHSFDLPYITVHGIEEV